VLQILYNKKNFSGPNTLAYFVDTWSFSQGGLQLVHDFSPGVVVPGNDLGRGQDLDDVELVETSFNSIFFVAEYARVVWLVPILR
jgi:hypothetical protein